MLETAGSSRSRRPGRESTRIAVLLLALAGCAGQPCCEAPPPSPLEKQGESTLQAGHPDEARAIFFQAMRGQEKPFIPWIGVARASLAMNDLSTAELAIGQAMKSDPGTAGSADLIGRTLLMIAQARGESGRSQAMTADLMFQRAARLDPSLPKLAYHRGLAYLAADQPGAAASLLERAVAADPADDDATRALLIAYQRSHQDDRARILVEQLRNQGRIAPALGPPPAAVSRPNGD